MRRAAIGLAVIWAFALNAASASAAEVWWYDDFRWGQQVAVSAEGDAMDLVIRGHDGTAFHPRAITVESRSATLTSDRPPQPPGVCDAGDGCELPCRIETPHRARCVHADGFTPRPPPLNPLEVVPGFGGGVMLLLSAGDDRVTVPTDNPVKLELHAPDGSGGSAGGGLMSPVHSEPVSSCRSSRIVWWSALLQHVNVSAEPLTAST